MDEYHGRKVAVSEGLFILPTLAVLERAAEKNMLDLPTAIEALKQTTCRVRPQLIEAALRRDAQRKQ